jgi:hypothetical protein
MVTYFAYNPHKPSHILEIIFGLLITKYKKLSSMIRRKHLHIFSTGPFFFFKRFSNTQLGESTDIEPRVVGGSNVDL